MYEHEYGRDEVERHGQCKHLQNLKPAHNYMHTHNIKSGLCVESRLVLTYVHM